MSHIKIISESINTPWCQWSLASSFSEAPPTKIKLVFLNFNMVNGICLETIIPFEGEFK